MITERGGIILRKPACRPLLVSLLLQKTPAPFNPTHRIDSRRQPRDSPPPPTEVPPPPWSAAARQYTERNGMRAAHYWLGNPDAFVEVACAQEVGRRGARARRRWSISGSGVKVHLGP
jgi:hypothetical protein